MKPLPLGLLTEPGSSVANTTAGWRTSTPSFLVRACTGCDLCLLFCPEGIVTRVDRKHYTFDERYCKGCGICAAGCPVDDIIMVSDG